MALKIAAVTMVRDDFFFLQIWLDYYGKMLGRENCYIVNHGHTPQVEDMAKGCNLIGIPGEHHRNFDRKRWRLLNNIVAGLGAYYDRIIVGDVDELVVVDPEVAPSLPAFIEGQRLRNVITPLGLEVIHRVDIEPEEIAHNVLGPRRHVRLAPHYSKPCMLGIDAKLSRGGHFAKFPRLVSPEGLYLFHLKFCDFPEYQSAMNRRNAITEEIGVKVREASIGGHWFAEKRGDDYTLFEGFSAYEMVEGFDMNPYRALMHETFQPREDTGFFEFEKPNYKLQFKLPERFSGIF